MTKLGQSAVSMDAKKDSFRIRPSTSRPQTVDSTRPQSDEDGSDDDLPTLEKVTGLPLAALEGVLQLELQWDCRIQSLQELGVVAHNLRELNLSGSWVESLRDLGTALQHLEVLWVKRCGMKDLEGISGFPVLKELYAAFNSVSSLSPLLFADTLEIVDLELNEIRDIQELQALEACTNLISLTLEGNPVSTAEGYRENVLTSLPGLLYLDDCSRESEDDGKPQYKQLEQPPDKFTSPLYTKWGVTKEQLDSALQSEPGEDEVLKKVLTTPKTTLSTVLKRPKTMAGTRLKPTGSIFKVQSSREQAISVLTEGVFAGNPVKAAQHKRNKYFGEGVDILTLLQEFKVEETEDLLSKEEEIRSRPQVVIRVRTIQTRKLVTLRHKPGVEEKPGDT